MARSVDAKGGPASEKAISEQLAGFERDVLVRLGAAVLEIWDRLPRELQQTLFCAAIAEPGELDLESLRRKLAVLLHAHHARTGRPLDPRMGGTHPPAGPHARPELTNFDATPGSGLLPPRRGRGKEVDPGAG